MSEQICGRWPHVLGDVRHWQALPLSNGSAASTDWLQPLVERGTLGLSSGGTHCPTPIFRVHWCALHNSDFAQLLASLVPHNTQKLFRARLSW